jgi:putative hydrolase of the HAD superfamily
MAAPQVISLDLDDTLWPVAPVIAAEVLHVGDDPLADVVGARQAGMQAVWLNRESRRWPGELAPPVRTISTLAEIL